MTSNGSESRQIAAPTKPGQIERSPTPRTSK
jgi:hypothetical protein